MTQIPSVYYGKNKEILELNRKLELILTDNKDLKEKLNDSRDIYRRVCRLIQQSKVQEPAMRLMVSFFNLTKEDATQLSLFDRDENKKNLVEAIDKINDRWREYMIIPAVMASTQKLVPDRIGFGNIGIFTN